MDTRWLILKKPWLVSDDLKFILDRFYSDPLIAFISVLMGNWPEKEIKKLMKEIKKQHTELFIELSEYKEKNLLISLFLEESNTTDCFEYNINNWIGECTSWYWKQPFNDEFRTPNMDPLKGELWVKDEITNKVYLPYFLINNPKQALEYIELKKLSENNFIEVEDRINKIKKCKDGIY